MSPTTFAIDVCGEHSALTNPPRLRQYCGHLLTGFYAAPYPTPYFLMCELEEGHKGDCGLRKETLKLILDTYKRSQHVSLWERIFGRDG